MPDFLGGDFSQVCTPPHCRAPRKLSSAPLDTIRKHCSMPLTTPHFVFHACHRLSHGIPHYSISHACHSHLPHANDMRFAACHSHMCPCLTCLQCVRRFLHADLAVRSPRKFDLRSGCREAVSGEHAPCTAAWLFHFHCTPIPCIMHADIA